MSNQPKVDYAKITMQEIGALGLRAAIGVFRVLDEAGALEGPNGSSLFVRLGEVSDGVFTQIVTDVIDDGEAFAENTHWRGGKIQSVVQFGMDSDDAVRAWSNEVPAGPPSWTGGVRQEAHVELNGKRYCKVFAGAASGVQGVYDKTTMKAATAAMAGAWIEAMRARDKANRPIDDLL